MNQMLRRAFLMLFLASCLLCSTGRAPEISLAHELAAAPEEPQGGKAEKHELLFKIINSAILVAALTFVLRKPLAEFFTQRSASIRKSLEEGRKALDASQAQLRAIEEKLVRLEEEIRALTASAAQEMAAERERLRQATAEEAEKVLEFARAQLETATRAAKLELKAYAAQEALKLAEDLIRERLDPASQKQLVSRFVDDLVEH